MRPVNVAAAVVTVTGWRAEPSASENSTSYEMMGCPQSWGAAHARLTVVSVSVAPASATGCGASDVGNAVGKGVGYSVGELEGDAVGDVVGTCVVGDVVGVGVVGETEGESVGDTEGESVVGDAVGASVVGDAEGASVGDAVGLATAEHTPETQYGDKHELAEAQAHPSGSLFP
jgi:hypothetical protein